MCRQYRVNLSVNSNFQDYLFLTKIDVKAVVQNIRQINIQRK